MKYLLVLFFIFTSSAIQAKERSYGSVYVSQVRSVYDGDTFYVDVDQWPGVVGKSMGIRINGIDTPEMRGKCENEKLLARKAKKALVSLLRNAEYVQLANLKRGKYFRIVADVVVDDLNVGQYLVGQGLAVEYFGGKKTHDWCG